MMDATLRRSHYGNIPAVELENDCLRLVVLPECGAKIRSIYHKPRRREWMWNNPHLPTRVPAGSTRYVAEFDNGGWDECFPTIGPGVLPSGPFAGMAVHDHGELWTLAWAVEAAEQVEGGCLLVTSVEVPQMPIRVRRSLSLPSQGASLRLRYEVTNLSRLPFDYIWACHAILPLEDGMRIFTPPRSSLSLSATINVPDFDGRTLEQHVASHGELPLPLGSNCTGFGYKGLITGDLAQGISIASVDGARFTCRFGPSDFDGLGLWVNAGAWSGCGSPPYRNIGFEPQIGRTDNLDEALRNDSHRAVLTGGSTKVSELEVELS